MADATVSSSSPPENQAVDGPARVIPFAPRPAEPEEPDPIRSLPFVKNLDEPLPNGRGRHFWSPELRGLDYDAATRVGYAYAFRCVEAIAAGGFTPLLGLIEKDMGEEKDREDAGIRAGFFEVFANIATMVAESGGGGLGWLEERYRERAAKVDAMLAEARAEGPDDLPPAA